MFIRRPYDIGVLVRAARQAHGLNQQDLADRLGVSRWWVNEFERGKPTARLDFVLRALAGLQITLTASTEVESEETAVTPAIAQDILDILDIDDIADTGLAPAATERASKPKRRRS